VPLFAWGGDKGEWFSYRGKKGKTALGKEKKKETLDPVQEGGSTGRREKKKNGLSHERKKRKKKRRPSPKTPRCLRGTGWKKGPEILVEMQRGKKEGSSTNPPVKEKRRGKKRAVPGKVEKERGKKKVKDEREKNMGEGKEELGEKRVPGELYARKKGGRKGKTSKSVTLGPWEKEGPPLRKIRRRRTREKRRGPSSVSREKDGERKGGSTFPGSLIRKKNQANLPEKGKKKGRIRLSNRKRKKLHVVWGKEKKEKG